MTKFFAMRPVVYFVLAAVALFFAQPLVHAGSPGKGSLTGFIYDQDKTTPVEGAVVVLKNLATGAVFESERSDALGAFKLADIDRGLYAFGVSSPKGGFSSKDVLGIAENETAKLAVALTPGAEVNPTAEDAPQVRGEKWIGKVISFDAATKMARIYINKDELEQDEDFHVKGDKKKYNSDTDFWQKAKVIQQNGLAVKKAVAGQYYNILFEKPALDNDFLYIKKSTAFGLLTILAGTTAIIYTIITDPDPVSTFRR